MDQQTTLRLLGRLGIRPQDLDQVRATPFPQSSVMLDELKARVKAAWKQLAFELHPDRNGNDPRKVEEFRDLTKVRDDFMALKVQARVQPQPMQGVRFVVMRQQPMPQYNTNPFTGSSTAPTGNTTHVWHYVNMRPT